ncbi:hypothetical protein NUU61_000707 [Penicillium alfredii]|uniref:DUF1746 domain-containing protein n=1 Tax=Penicillium alfredii TaxID=1506179 RepID=A0A9W9GAK9_9EURO|nr:uncharacterized protein NUU61_000707 [Penicillium alfredii]KAJ5114948.1 hypothetical protein NUU61_000707 [Penicillium alfredii]
MTDVEAFRDAEYLADVSGISYDDAEPTGTLSSDDSRVRKAQSATKVAFIDRLLRDLDVLIYCQLSALYYMDCSIVLFAARAVIELIFFTPKVPPFDPTRNQPYVGAIIASNLFCMLLHAFFIRPEAGESTRGYLHGGLFIDFIGQTPVSVFRLLVFDVLVFLVDVVMLALVIERVKTVGSNPSTTSATTATTTGPGTEADQSFSQDHDSEERGVLRQGETSRELDGAARDDPTSLSLSGSAIDEDAAEERTTLLADPGEGASARGSRDRHPLDSFSTGQTIIVHMGFLDTLRDQWRYSTTPNRPTGYVPSPETATFLRQRFGLQVGTDGRIVRVDQ